MAILGGKKGPSSGNGKKGDSKPAAEPTTMKSLKETKNKNKADKENTEKFNNKYGVGKKDAPPANGGTK